MKLNSQSHVILDRHFSKAGTISTSALHCHQTDWCTFCLCQTIEESHLCGSNNWIRALTSIIQTRCLPCGGLTKAIRLKRLFDFITQHPELEGAVSFLYPVHFNHHHLSKTTAGLFFFCLIRNHTNRNQLVFEMG